MVQATLTVIKGPGSGAILVVRYGQVVRVGRTDWSDFSVPGDPEMSDVHFAIEYLANGCRVRNLSGDAETLVNGQAIPESLLHAGDEIGAGQSVFSVLVDSKSELGTADSPDGDQVAVASPAAPTLKATDFVQHIELDEDGLALLNPQQSPKEFLDLLNGDECFPDAIKFLAIWLPKAKAVAWAGQCLRDTFGDELPVQDEAAIQAAECWSAEPTEENRLAAGAAGEAIGNEGAAGLLTLAAFVSEGSMAAPDLAPVPPPEGLTARIISAALTLAVYHGEPGTAESRHQEFIAAGQKLAAPSAAK